uniref:Uncharacterized protein n=1 Tax=Cucumis melo TaxID=3656 RepID=A0A9I9DQP7_CUCME
MEMLTDVKMSERCWVSTWSVSRMWSQSVSGVVVPRAFRRVAISTTFGRRWVSTTLGFQRRSMAKRGLGAT